MGNRTVAWMFRDGGGGCLSIQDELGAGGLGACSPRKLF